MGMNLGQAFVGISTDAKDLDKGLAEAQAHVSNAVLGMKKDIESIASSFSFVGSAARAIAGAYGLKEVLGIGESYETSIIKMRYTYTENTEAMIAQAKRMSQESGNFFSFPEIADTMLKTKDLATEMGLSQAQYLEGMSRALGVAAVKGLDLESAMRLIERAATGAKRAGTQLGVAVSDQYMQFTAYNGVLANTWKSYDEGSKFILRWSEVMRQSAKYSGGDMVMATQTLEGALKALGNELKAQLGPEIAETVKGLTDNVKGMAPVVREVGSALLSVISTYNSLPDFVKGPLGIGIIGAVIFGGSAGATIAAIAAVVEAAKKQAMNCIHGDPLSSSSPHTARAQRLSGSSL